MKPRLRLTLMIIASLAIMACSPTGNVVYEQDQYTQVYQNNYNPVTHEVNITKFNFDPKTITIKEGDRIIFTNVGVQPAKILDTSTYLDESPRMDYLDYYTHTFSRPGTFTYEVQGERTKQKRNHNEQLGKGTITVVVRE